MGIFTKWLLAVAMLFSTVRGIEMPTYNETAPVDLYEPNDSSASATLAQAGTTYKGVLSSQSDKDYFCVPVNGHTSLSYTFTHRTSRKVHDIGWQISYDSVYGKTSRMAWLDDKEIEEQCDDIVKSDDYFVVWVERRDLDSYEQEVIDFVSNTEYSITFYYGDGEETKEEEIEEEVFSQP